MPEQIEFCNTECELAKDCESPLLAANPAISAENLCPEYAQNTINPKSSSMGTAVKVLELAINRGDRGILEESRERMLNVVTNKIGMPEGQLANRKGLYGNGLHIAYMFLSCYELFGARVDRRQPDPDEIDIAKEKLESALKVTYAAFLELGENLRLDYISALQRGKALKQHSELKGKVSLTTTLLLSAESNIVLYPSSFREVQGFGNKESRYKPFYHSCYALEEDGSRRRAVVKSHTLGRMAFNTIYLQNLATEAMQEIDPDGDSQDLTFESMVSSLFSNPDFRRELSMKVADDVNKIQPTPSHG